MPVSYNSRGWYATSNTNTYTNNGDGWTTVADFATERIKKPIKKKLPKCYICKKILRNKAYIIKAYGVKTEICSNCKHIYTVFRKLFDTKENKRILGNIFSFVFGSPSSKTFTVKSLQRTNRNGTFIKPSIVIQGYWSPSNNRRQQYFRMENKCCKFCEKQFIKAYTLIESSAGEKIRICRDCEYLFKIMIEERRREKENTIRRIYEILAHIN